VTAKKFCIFHGLVPAFSHDCEELKTVMTHEPFSLTEYAEFTHETALYPGSDLTAKGGSFDGRNYVALGLAGEAGEVANDVKKIFRDDGKELSPERKKRILGELGDVFWYWTRSCMEFGFTPEFVAKINMEKLRNRKAAGTLQGSGSDR